MKRVAQLLLMREQPELPALCCLWSVETIAGRELHDVHNMCVEGACGHEENLTSFEFH